MERYDTRDLAVRTCLQTPSLVNNIILPPCKNAGSINDAMERCLAFVGNIMDNKPATTSANSSVLPLQYAKNTCRNLQFIQWFGYIFMIVSAASICFIFLYQVIKRCIKPEIDLGNKIVQNLSDDEEP